MSESLLWLEYLVLVLVLLAGMVLTVATLPGTWLMCGGLAVFAFATRSHHLITWRSLTALIVLAVVAEIIDTFASGAGAKKAGASRRAMIGAVVGGLLGAIFLSFILLFPLGTIAGACIGCFVGASVVELMVRRDVGQSIRVGLLAAWGRLVGIVAKVMVAIVMLCVGAYAGLPLLVQTPTPTKALITTRPSTGPATQPN